MVKLMSRFRPWPRSLAGQMILLMLLVLILAQVFGFWFLADERKAALRAMGRDVTAERIESVLRLLQETPQSLHDKVTVAASDGRIRFSLDGISQITESDALEIPRFQMLYRGRLEEMGVLDIRVRMVELDLPPWHRLDLPKRGERWDRDRDGHDRDRWRHPNRDQLRGGLFELSLQLADGRWLNVSHHLPPRPYIWALAEFLTLFGSATALILMVIVMIRRITRPVRTLADASDALGRGADVPVIQETGAAEIRHATRAFNDMNMRLKRFMKDRLAILAALSHDLRTPITTLRLRAEFIEDEENREKVLETIDEIAEMTEVTLSFVREDTATEHTRLTDFAALLETVCDDLADQGKTVMLKEITGRPLVQCRPVALKRALRNLIENADKYGDGAAVSIEAQEGQIAVLVEDDGPGIPEEKLEDIFQPFVRLEESRSRDTGGIGMGLAIARMIARGHGGDIVMENRVVGGLRAILTLPLSG
ncbi:ATP-binding protein [Aestuariispira insulae]|uniref:histidine kinase n=1 Tax=Aestuariispira insulae TaxID=1461337 RepID=A0A3D9HQU0_9PROT|nr:ATP-binding protein [Aestuariispira insulae]RED51276.1 signal transduction histidine kinase [Aestuariispira insulae]